MYVRLFVTMHLSRTSGEASFFLPYGVFYKTQTKGYHSRFSDRCHKFTDSDIFWVYPKKLKEKKNIFYISPAAKRNHIVNTLHWLAF